MDFSSSPSNIVALKDNRKKKKKKKRKMSSNVFKSQSVKKEQEELAAFLFLLQMPSNTNNDIGMRTPLWCAESNVEAEMSSKFINAILAANSGDIQSDTYSSSSSAPLSVIEEEFIRYFRIFSVQKRFLERVEKRRLQDRLFAIMTKRKVAETSASSSATEQILWKHFLYEELRLQHRLLTQPQISDTPNDTAFKIMMVPTICGLIRNHNEEEDDESRGGSQSSGSCLQVKDDDAESEALCCVEVAAPGSCVAAVLRPLYLQLTAAAGGRVCSETVTTSIGSDDEDSDVEGGAGGLEKVKEVASSGGDEIDVLAALRESGLPAYLLEACTSGSNSMAESVPSSGSKDDPALLYFFEGPPEWHSNLPFFLKRVEHSMSKSPSPERQGYVKHALRRAQEYRVLRDQQKFYDVAYASAHWYANHNSADFCEEPSPITQDYSSFLLSFGTHLLLHRAAYAVVSVKPSAATSAETQDVDEVMTLASFKKKVKVQLPHLIISPCKRCRVPCAGECLCGASYCSPSCLAWDQAEGAHRPAQCRQACPEEVWFLTPVAWSRPALQL